VVAGRTSAVVPAALEHVPPPETIHGGALAMAGALRAAVQAVRPDAASVADKVHVIARISAAGRAVWRRLVRGQGRADPLGRRGRGVLRGREQLSSEEVTLRAVLPLYPAWRRAWLLQEDCRRW
jgi:transposase